LQQQVTITIFIFPPVIAFTIVAVMLNDLLFFLIVNPSPPESIPHTTKSLYRGKVPCTILLRSQSIIFILKPISIRVTFHFF